MVRGDAKALTAKIEGGDFQGLSVKAIVKETGIDDEGLNEFYNEYFPHDTYKDGELKFYHALGSGKMNLGFNPMAIFQLIQRSTKEKGNVKGEGFLQGGWILFKPDGEPVAAFQENAKKRVPIDNIVAAIKKMREEK